MFLSLENKSVSTNLGRCARECGLKTKKDEMEGNLVTSFHARHHEDYWVIESGCSNHMTKDKSKFTKLEKYGGWLVILGYDFGAKIVGKGTIIFYGKHSVDDV